MTFGERNVCAFVCLFARVIATHRNIGNYTQTQRKEYRESRKIFTIQSVFSEPTGFIL